MVLLEHKKLYKTIQQLLLMFLIFDNTVQREDIVRRNNRCLADIGGSPLTSLLVYEFLIAFLTVYILCLDSSIVEIVTS